MTPLAHAVRFAMRCGITRPADLARELECTQSAIYRAMKQLKDADRTVTETDPAVTCDRTELTQRSQTDPAVTKTDRTVTDAPRAHARIETPSGLLSQLEIYSPPSVPPKPKTAAKRGSRLPSDWTLPAEWRNWAEVNFAYATDDQIAIEADKFRDYWVAKPRDATKLDWFATWKNWCRTAFGSPRGRTPYNAGRMAYDERKARSQNSQPPAVHLAWLKNPPTAEELEAIRA